MEHKKLPKILLSFLIASFVIASIVIFFTNITNGQCVECQDIFLALLTLFSLTLSLIVFITAKKGSMDSTFWRWQSITIALLFAAEVTWAIYEILLHVEVPWLSVVDIFWVAAYGFQFTALIYLMRNTYIEKPCLYLSLALGALFLTVLYLLFIGQVIVAGDISVYEKIIYVFYSFLDVVSTVICLPILITAAKSKAKIFRPIFFIAIGYTVFAVYDSVYYYLLWHEKYYSGHPFDLIYNTAYLLLGLAAYSAYKNIIDIRQRIRVSKTNA